MQVNREPEVMMASLMQWLSEPWEGRAPWDYRGAAVMRWMTVLLVGANVVFYAFLVSMFVWGWP